jgi:LPS O-antigen subunit length determinant protein (WzzB/FepE family)
MSLPFRNNPKIVTNWFHKNTKNVQPEKQKRAYYNISTSKPGWLVIQFREEKKRLGGSAEREEHWYGSLEFELESSFAKDLKMFLNEYVEGVAPEIEQRKIDSGEMTKMR